MHDRNIAASRSPAAANFLASLIVRASRGSDANPVIRANRGSKGDRRANVECGFRAHCGDGTNSDSRTKCGVSATCGAAFHREAVNRCEAVTRCEAHAERPANTRNFWSAHGYSHTHSAAPASYDGIGNCVARVRFAARSMSTTSPRGEPTWPRS